MPSHLKLLAPVVRRRESVAFFAFYAFPSERMIFVRRETCDSRGLLCERCSTVGQAPHSDLRGFPSIRAHHDHACDRLRLS